MLARVMLARVVLQGWAHTSRAVVVVVVVVVDAEACIHS
jgi:hypothetical protein